MAAKIDDILINIKAHLLNCVSVLHNGYENVRQLSKGIAGNDANRVREYEDVRISDQLGNYFWIEKNGDVSILGNTALSSCGTVALVVSQPFTLYALGHNLDEAKFFHCVISCVAAYGCGHETGKIKVVRGDYETLKVADRIVGTELANTIKNIGNFAVISIDFRIEYMILPTLGDECECEACKDC